MSSGFVTETELAEARKKRQEEWEKVRSADEPLERPEEPLDSRSLYDRLKEQKMKKDLEYEEAHKLKNLIRGLDDDEVQFLDLVDRSKMKAEKQQQIEEQKELNDFRQRVATLQEISNENKIQSELLKPKTKIPHNSNRLSQKSILVGAVTKKRLNGEIDDENETSSKKALIDDSKKNEEPSNESIGVKLNSETIGQGAFRCIGILPGIGRYRESSDSEISTGSDEEPDCGKYDLFGRKSCTIKKRCDSE